MADIISFELKPSEYVELAATALKSGDDEKAIGYLKKALSIEPEFTKASIELAKIYSDKFNAVIVSDDVLYKALFAGAEEESVREIYFLLAMNCMKTSDVDAASYYLRDVSDEFEFEYEDIIPDFTEDGYRLVYPRGDAYYNDLLAHCYGLVKQSKFDEAMEDLNEIDSRSKYFDSANQLKLLIHMLKNDTDGIIDEAKSSLNVKDNLSVKCTLATAYMMENKKDEAYAVVDEIARGDYKNPEEIAAVLPMFVNFEAHNEVVKYCKRLLETNDKMINVMVWLSQGLYNIGQKKEAAHLMRRVHNIFGDYSPAAYYLDLYKSDPDTVQYNLGLPYAEIITRFSQLNDYLKLNDLELAVAFEVDKNFRYLLEWAFGTGYNERLTGAIERLGALKRKSVCDFLRYQLVKPDISFEIMSQLILALLNFTNSSEPIRFDVVAQDRYKNVLMALPEAYFNLPSVFRRAVDYAVCDIIFTDEEPTYYLEVLKDIIDSVALPAGGGLIYAHAKAEKVQRLRSMKTIVGVLLARVYADDEEPVEDALLRYGLNKRTFDKYDKIIFGEDD